MKYLIIILIILFPVSLFSSIWYVSPNGDNSNGLTWNTAYTTWVSLYSSESTAGDTIYCADELDGVFQPGPDGIGKDFADHDLSRLFSAVFRHNRSR